MSLLLIIVRSISRRSIINSVNKVASLSVNTLSEAVFVLNINVEVYVLYGRIDLKMFFLDLSFQKNYTELYNRGVLLIG
ncbi:phenylalanyl-tRNA synthetase class IIc [Bacillus anthracis]|nr:phenylalanyl-tRNA synthetase class IIc [Bacillus anthracis]GAO63725.1 phenylalanyl-tRNA synthetase class IIc [Bacillus anthracis]